MCRAKLWRTTVRLQPSHRHRIFTLCPMSLIPCAVLKWSGTPSWLMGSQHGSKSSAPCHPQCIEVELVVESALGTFAEASASEGGLRRSVSDDEAEESQRTWSLARCSGVSAARKAPLHLQLASWGRVSAVSAASKANLSHYSVQQAGCSGDSAAWKSLCRSHSVRLYSWANPSWNQGLSGGRVYSSGQQPWVEGLPHALRLKGPG